MVRVPQNLSRRPLRRCLGALPVLGLQLGILASAHAQSPPSEAANANLPGQSIPSSAPAGTDAAAAVHAEGPAAQPAEGNAVLPSPPASPNDAALLLPPLVALPVAVPPPARVRPQGAPLQLRWTQVRANAQVVQNATGNAYSLQAGWTPKLRLRDVPVGLQLLAEIGGLRTVRKEVFVMPSVQGLVTWQVLDHLELAIGAGVQFWCLPTRVVRPLATLEAHYVPHRRIAKVIRSAFVASSLGASSGAGLQVRAGISFDFQRDDDAAPATVHVASHLPTSALAAPPLHLRPPRQIVCPPCPACLPATPAQASDAPLPPEDVVLATHLTFAFNSAALLDEEVAYLNALAAALDAEPEAWDVLEVVGHADAVGTTAHTQLISEHRTKAVAGVLLEAGVPPQRLDERAVGEGQPIEGLPPEAPAQRRVVLRLRGYRGSARLDTFVRPGPAGHEVPKEATP